MEIYSQNIYEVNINNSKKHVLIIYNISNNHYIGIPINNNIGKTANRVNPVCNANSI